MASIETLRERIANAESTIEKKGNTIEKKQKLIAKKTVESVVHPEKERWLSYDIEHLNEDIKRLMKEREEKREALKRYKDELSKLEGVKRDIPSLVEFLNGWKKKATEYYLSMEKDWTRLDAYNKYLTADRKACDYWNCRRWLDVREGKLTDDEAQEKYEELRNKAKALKKAYFNEYGNIHDLVQRAFNTKTPYAVLVEEMLQREWEFKYDDLLYRCESHVGKLVDTCFLHIGKNGSINGYVVGEKGRARVETIWAGGPIQRLHFRVLIHDIKD